MKNYVKEGQKLPLFGIGPYLISSLAMLSLIGIILSGNVLSSGRVSGIWFWVFIIAGILFILSGIFIWYKGALGSKMDEYIENNKLKTDGIYAWVRNPMYSGVWYTIIEIPCTQAYGSLLQVLLYYGITHGCLFCFLLTG